MPSRNRLAILPAALLCAAIAASPAWSRDAIRKVPAGAATQPTPPAASPALAAPPTADAARTRPGGERGELSVMIDRAKVIRIPERTQTVVIGNPSVADISVQKSGVVVVTGKSYGVTNLIALDQAGNVLAESNVSVTAPSDSVVVVQRGLDRQSYSCNPNCLPSVSLGDANNFFTEHRGQADQRNQFATQR